MQVKFQQAETVNGHPANFNDLEVFIDGSFWGYVSGPAKGQRGEWMSIAGYELCGERKITPGDSWKRGGKNKEAALLASLTFGS
jgi:hypothetical protein